ncbi:toprim domain-containing protein [Rhizobium sp. TRM95796]|uniref:toprim domain-containing protein n=1 Tax=Rhizobium sp. TRM95796 TaxID=2979862 RepID=UPI0021E8D161|nr:toprim domain-containing protein [Rhizobium sp. TRM95796]MCV3768156.1 toprim domain-containing protein [Rhizobium sp. TRM95796]
MSRSATQVVGATDANPQGEIFADRLRGLSEAMSSDWLRLRPPADDWNEVLQDRLKENADREIGGRRAASRSTASREASPG